MKKRVLLALTMAMATAAMFISPALSDMVGLPSMVVSATSNNTTPPTQTPPSQNRPSKSIPRGLQAGAGLWSLRFRHL